MFLYWIFRPPLHQHPPPAPPQPVQTQSSATAPQASKKQKTVNDAITSSLSSSINMKRGRDDLSSSEASSSDESDADTTKNRIVAPGLKRHGKVEAKRARMTSMTTAASSSTNEVTTKKRVAFADKDASLSAKPTSSSSTILSSVKKLVLPTLSQIIGGKKLSPKKALAGK